MDKEVIYTLNDLIPYIQSVSNIVSIGIGIILGGFVWGGFIIGFNNVE